MSTALADVPFTLRGYRSAALRRSKGSAPAASKPARRDELADSLAAANEIAEILAAQNGDSADYYRHQASQIVGFMMNSGWVLTRR